MTDAMAAMGLGPGVHRLGTQDIVVEGGHALIKGQKTLAGRYDSRIHEFEVTVEYSPLDLCFAVLFPITLILIRGLLLHGFLFTVCALECMM